MECFYCKQAGRNGSVALRVVGGKGVCGQCFDPRTNLVVKEYSENEIRNEGQEERKMPKSSNIDGEAVKRDYLSGLSTVEIGRKFGVHSTTVNNHLHRMGVQLRQGGPGRRPPVAAAPRQAKAAIVKTAPMEPHVSPASLLGRPADLNVGTTKPNGAARCRVVMFEVTGDAGVLSALDAIKVALQNRS